MSSVEYPTCDKDDFASEESMRSHQMRIQGESLRVMIELSYDWCGELYEVPLATGGRSRKFIPAAAPSFSLILLQFAPPTPKRK